LDTLEKVLKIYTCHNEGYQKDIMGVKFFNVLIGENQISCFKINKNENDFMDNLHDV
jgi:hypothetical protein